MYEVLIKGEVIDGFQESEVVKDFCRLCNITPEKARQLLSGKVRSVKKQLPKQTAEKWVEKLVSIGVMAKMRSMEAYDIETVSKSELTLVPKPGEQSIDSTQIWPFNNKQSMVAASSQDVSTVKNNSSTKTFSCPKCHTQQKNMGICSSCGLVFAKYELRQQRNSNQKSTLSESRTLSISPKGRGIPVMGIIAGVLGALVWYGVALAFEVEMALIAWAIGGAVGFACTLSNPQGGTRIGAFAAGIAVVAIISGKYLIVQHFVTEFLVEQQQLSQQIGIEIGSDEAMIEWYSSQLLEQGELSELEAYDYETMQTRWNDLSFQQKEEQRQQAKKMLDDIFNEELSVSPSDIVSSLDFIDIIFLLLGMITAYRLAEQGRQ